MANTIEYIFSLQDKVSAKIGNITVTSDRMLGRFAELERRTQSVSRTFNETGRTLGSLREKIALLQAEREWIPAENIEGIRAYNREINRLNREITQLESLNGGKFQKWSKEAFSAIPGSNLISNPLVAGVAALGFAGKSAMGYDEGMAKVNITAQLDEKGLDDLNRRLKKVAKDNKTDVSIAPVGLEKIISQVGEADLSIEILDAALKGSKAGFTDLDTVSGALAQSLSVIGKENTNATEVLDTFFAAKRVGAGEFADFAKYMPGLIAGASNMGINFKEVAGTFAYMTGKGQSAERAAVLMENAFSVLGKADIRAKMEKAGVKVFDEQGKIRGMVDIFTDLKGVLNGMTDEQKSSILEKFGLVDKEAKNAFALMTSDLDKLQGAMDATGTAAGETEKAMTFSKNSVQKATEVWNQFKNIGADVGEVILPVISAGLDVIGVLLGGVSAVIQSVFSFFSGWFGLLVSGNPLIWGLTAAVGALSAALLVNYARTNAAVVATKVKMVWDGLQTAATWMLTTAQWALNAAFYASPLGWICLAIGAVTAAIMYCWNHFEGFRKFIMGMWEVIKEFGRVLIDAIVSPFKQVIKGIGSVGSALVSLVKGDFKEAAAAAKSGFKDIGNGMLNASPVMAGVNTFKNGNWSDAWEKGQQKGAQSWQASQDKKKEDYKGIDSLIPAPPQPTASGANFDDLMKKLAKTKKAGNKGKKKVINLNETSKTAQDYKETSDYTAVTKKLEPVKANLSPVSHTMAKTDSAGKVIDGRPRFARADDTRQQYEPEKENYLADIMRNVRKIAAVAAIPLAVNIAAPAQAGAKPVQDNDKLAFTRIEQPAVIAEIPALSLRADASPVQEKVQQASMREDAPVQPVQPLVAVNIPAPVTVPDVSPAREKAQQVQSPDRSVLELPVQAAMPTDMPVPSLTLNVSPAQEKAQPVKNRKQNDIVPAVLPVMMADTPEPVTMPDVSPVQDRVRQVLPTDMPAPVLTLNVSPAQEKVQPDKSRGQQVSAPPVQPVIVADIPAPVPVNGISPAKEKLQEIPENPFSVQPVEYPQMPGIYAQEPATPGKGRYVQELAGGVHKLVALSEKQMLAGAIPADRTNPVQEKAFDYVNRLPQGGNDILIPEMAVPDTNVYNIDNTRDERISERTSVFSEKETVRETGKVIRVDKFCDQIVIHVENTDKKGESEIREAVLRVMNQIYEV